MPTGLCSVASFVEETFAAFEEAARRAGGATERRIRLADRGVALRFAAPVLEQRFGAAFAHLLSAANHPSDLIVGCWDRASTGVRLPLSPWSLEQFLPHGRIRGHVDGPVRATFDPVSRALALYDQRRATAAFYAADPAVVPHWMDRAPLRTILSWWAADRGLVFLHAAAVATEHGAVAIAGSSGSGKSTTALAGLAAGLRLIGDDACLVSLDHGPEVFSVYRYAKVVPDALARLPGLQPAVTWHHGEMLIDPGRRRVLQAPLRALLLPQVVSSRQSRVQVVTPGEAIRVLGPSTVVEGGAVAGATLASVARLVTTVPCLRLELGSDVAGVVAAVRRVAEGQR